MMLRLSILIPVYNEERTILEAITRLRDRNFPLETEIIVINDGSSDATAKILKAVNGIKVVSYSKNKGKGFAIQIGLQHATGDIIAIQDADLEYHPKDLLQLIQPIIYGKTNVVYGSRMLQKNKMSYLHFYLGSCLLNLMIWALYFVPLSDFETGYKVLRREVLMGLNLKSNGFDIEAEITAKLLRKGECIIEVPISYTPRTFSEGKKIRVKDGLQAIWVLLYYRFNFES